MHTFMIEDGVVINPYRVTVPRPKKIPVSRKAYDILMIRIELACREMPSLQGMPDAIATLVNEYLLHGMEAVLKVTDTTLRLAFELLRYDIDKAMRRSEAARARAAARRARIEAEAAAAEEAAVPVMVMSPPVDVHPAQRIRVSRRLSRRERREALRKNAKSGRLLRQSPG